MPKITESGKCSTELLKKCGTRFSRHGGVAYQHRSWSSTAEKKMAKQLDNKVKSKTLKKQNLQIILSVM